MLSRVGPSLGLFSYSCVTDDGAMLPNFKGNNVGLSSFCHALHDPNSGQLLLGIFCTDFLTLMLKSSFKAKMLGKPRKRAAKTSLAILFATRIAF